MQTVVEKVIGAQHEISTSTPTQPIKTGERMKALIWWSAKDVRFVDASKPAITDPRDAVLKVTKAAICGSDLHLYHNMVHAMNKGDILGYAHIVFCAHFF